MPRLSSETLEDYMHVAQPDSDRLKIADSRRMTGPGMLMDTPGAVLDVAVDGFAGDAVVAAWARQAARVTAALDWPESVTASRTYAAGVTLQLSAPIDRLYTAVFANETAFHLAAHELLGSAAGPFDRLVDALREMAAAEAEPALVELHEAARARGVDLLLDDETLSLGLGAGSQSWPRDALPDPDAIDWNALHGVPVALVTGTNGKSTSVRLLAAIGEAAGLVSGCTSTDYVRVGDAVLDEGDWSGPGGARLLLRDSRLEFGVLEVARGGILRRGLSLAGAGAALVTNIAADHLGQYGIDTVEALAEAKFAVARALSPDGTLVLNADDPLVVANGRQVPRACCWFSLDPDNALVKHARDNAEPACWFDEESLHCQDADGSFAVAARDVPITMDGHARFNVQNALGAIGVARVLGLPFDAIRRGLTGFRPNREENPGRCNSFDVGGAEILVDFAHNPHAVSAMAELVGGRPARRRFVLLSQAGDRSDAQIAELTRAATRFGPDLVVVAELEEYLRGRESGEARELIAEAALANGIPAERIERVASPADGVALILDRIDEGDLALVLALSDRDRIFQLIEKAQRS